MILPLRLPFTAQALATGPLLHRNPSVWLQRGLLEVFTPSKCFFGCNHTSRSHLHSCCNGGIDASKPVGMGSCFSKHNLDAHDGQQQQQQTQNINLSSPWASTAATTTTATATIPTATVAAARKTAAATAGVMKSSALCGKREGTTHERAGDMIDRPGVGDTSTKSMMKNSSKTIEGEGGDSNVVVGNGLRLKAYRERKRQALREIEGKGRAFCNKCRRSQKVSCALLLTFGFGSTVTLHSYPASDPLCSSSSHDHLVPVQHRWCGLILILRIIQYKQ